MSDVDSTMKEFVDGPEIRKNKVDLDSIFNSKGVQEKSPRTVYFKPDVLAKIQKIQKKYKLRSISDVVGEVLDNFLKNKKI